MLYQSHNWNPKKSRYHKTEKKGIANQAKVVKTAYLYLHTQAKKKQIAYPEFTLINYYANPTNSRYHKQEKRRS